MSFPEVIFNGIHSQRSDLGTTMAASHFDYIILSREIGAVQKYVKELAQNIELMPNLEESLEQANQQINTIKLRFKELTPPEDLRQQLVKLEEAINEIDMRNQVAALRRDLETLRIMVTENQLKVLKLTESFQNEVKGFQNQVWSTLHRLQQTVEDRLVALETQMGQLNNLVQINNLLSKLK